MASYKFHKVQIILGPNVRDIVIKGFWRQMSSSTSRTTLSGSAERQLDSAFQELAEYAENAPGGPTPKSRTSVSKVVSVVSSFDNFKRSLVQEIGWGGILNIPALNRLNLKFSKWTMSRVDSAAMAVALDDRRKIRFWAADIHNVFGIPCGSRDIPTAEINCPENTKNLLRTALGMPPEKGNSVLKSAEIIILRPLSEETSSILEVDCFKMAFVIFCMGHLLAPSTKHDSVIIDYWGALSNTDHICEFNWCQYILLDMVAASQQVQTDITNSRPVTYLHGCHVFLQIFVLDNLDLGIYNMRHDIFPRISAFDDGKMRGMILQCTNPGKGDLDYSIAQIRRPESVCYTRALFDKAPDINSGIIITATPSSSLPFINNRKANISINQKSGKEPPVNMVTPASTDVGILFKRHNAIAPLQSTLLRNSLIQENTRFLDSLMSLLQDSCVCCRIRSLPCCITKHTNQNSTTTPFIRPQRLDMNKFEESGSACILTSSNKKNNSIPSDLPVPVHKKHKAVVTEDSQVGLYHPDNLKTPIQHIIPSKLTTIEQAKTWADTIVGGILLFSEEHNLPNGAVVFGQVSPISLNKPSCHHSGFPSDHWSLGRSLEKPPPHLVISLHTRMYQLTKPQISRIWFTHAVTRYISISGVVILDELVRDSILDHELCSIIIRCLTQIDRNYLYFEEPVWRHFLEADFSTIVLSGQLPWEVKSIQDQFYGQNVPYHIGNCRMFIIPALLQHGWCAYAWDMKHKCIHVLDPIACSNGYTNLKFMHEAVADKLHVSLFTCFFKFFTDWHTECIDWTKNYETITYEKITRSESGAAMIHMIRNFDGVGIKEHLNKDSIKIQKLIILSDLVKLEGNTSSVPVDIANWLHQDS
ncbi:hypothetical protein VPH35_134469 [Triticum aestivum]|uniref:Ubiquitin-like protease family profile domain-containing protein n=1 Tax=Aegilops tauschii TaxID=37682 RepID=R7WFY6_AEGTA